MVVSTLGPCSRLSWLEVEALDQAPHVTIALVTLAQELAGAEWFE